MTETEPSDVFEEVGEKSSSAPFRPKVVALVLSNSEHGGPNLMTASWWMVAGYNPYRVMLAVSHKTYTHELIEENPEFVLAAPSIDMVDALTLSGKVSGRDLDKIEHLGMETLPGEAVDVPLLKNAVANIEARVLDSFDFESTTYYIASVENAFVQPDALDGRLLSLDTDILAYIGSDWGEEETMTKYRYYADLGPENLEAYPGDEVVETLPEELQEAFK